MTRKEVCLLYYILSKSICSDSEVSPANTENESWSVCSSGADDLQELPDEVDDKPAGQLTPKASDDSPPAEEWEKWDQQETKNGKNS